MTPICVGRFLPHVCFTALRLTTWDHWHGGITQSVALFDISISDIDCRYIDTFEKYRYRYRYRYGEVENIDIDIDIDRADLEYIDIDIDIDKEFLKNIDIDIDKEILENIDIDKISN